MLALVSPLTLLGCGGSRQDTFGQEYPAVSAHLRALNNGTARAFADLPAALSPDGRSDQLRLARAAEARVEELEGLSPSSGAKETVQRLIRRVRAVRKDLLTVARGVKDYDLATAKPATQQLILDLAAVRLLDARLRRLGKTAGG